jgi:hypothetical protein
MHVKKHTEDNCHARDNVDDVVADTLFDDVALDLEHDGPTT